MLKAELDEHVEVRRQAKLQEQRTQLQEEMKLEAKVRRELNEMNAEYGHKSPPQPYWPANQAPGVDSLGSPHYSSRSNNPSLPGLSSHGSPKGSQEPVSPAGSVVALANEVEQMRAEQVQMT